VRWRVVGQIATAWTLTIPAAAMLGGVAWEIASRFGLSSNTGAIVIAGLGTLGALVLSRLARRNNITPDQLDRTDITPEIEAELADAAGATRSHVTRPAGPLRASA
jgi:PiT family inorganic phosphate transporter